MSLSPILIEAASLCCCAEAETDTPANNAAATIDGSFPVFMGSSLPAPAGPTLFQQTFSMLILPKSRAESTERVPTGPREAQCIIELMQLTRWRMPARQDRCCFRGGAVKVGSLGTKQTSDAVRQIVGLLG